MKNNNTTRRLVAVAAFLVSVPLAAVGIRTLSTGAVSEKKGPRVSGGMAGDSTTGKRFEIRVNSGSGLEIQRAITSLPPQGGRVILGAGTFTVSQPVVIDRDDVELSGDQELTILKLADQSNCPLLVVGQSVTPVQRKVTGVSIRKLILDGNRVAQDEECSGGPCDNGGWSFIPEQRSDHPRRGGCARDARDRPRGPEWGRGAGRRAAAAFTSVTSRPRTTHFDGFAAYETEDSVFTRMYLHGNAAAGISADIRFNHNIVSHARLENNGSQGIFMRDSNFNTFTRLTVDKNGAQGIFLAQADDAQNTPCTGNVFTDLTVTNNKGAGLRVNDVSCVANSVANSRFERNGEGGISEASEGLVAQVHVVSNQ